MAGRRVLIVDSHGNMTLALELLFAQHGFETRVSRTGEEALATAEKERPDCVVLAADLPFRSGFETCQMLRQRTASDRPKVIMIPSTGMALEQVKAGSVGADACLEWPISTAELVRTARTLLELPA